MQVCTKCGEEKPIDAFFFRKVRKTYYTHCKVCHGKNKKESKFSSYWWRERHTEEELALFSCLKNLVTKAKLRKRKQEDNVTWETIHAIWVNQKGLCNYSGVPLSIKDNHPHKVSIDRIDSSKGYIEGNLQLVSASVNRMKQEFTEEFFLQMCKKITDNVSKTTQEQGPLGTDPPVDTP